jgi:hypothetical protein
MLAEDVPLHIPAKGEHVHGVPTQERRLFKAAVSRNAEA